MCSRIVALGLLLAGAPAAAERADVAFLLDGVEAIFAPGVPGPLCVYGKKAFPVVAGGYGGGSGRLPVVAAARLGSGRIVAFGHGGYLTRGATEHAGTRRLLVQAARWAAGGARRVTVRVDRRSRLGDFWAEEGFAAADDVPSAEVLCIDAGALRGKEDVQAVEAFVREGGGLLIASLGWGWLQLNEGRSLERDHLGNRLLASAGIQWADGTLRETVAGGYAANDPPPPWTHARPALRELSAEAADVLVHALRTLPEKDRLFRPELERAAQRALQRVTDPGAPVGRDEHLRRVGVAWELERLGRLPAEEIRAHPAARSFPGEVAAGARREARTVSVDCSRPGWHGTGLYAAPGDTVRVRLPADAIGRGLHVRIGAHTDALWHHARWERYPAITRRFPLIRAETPVASAFGGLLYVDVPAACGAGVVEVAIEGAVAAPRFVLGETAPEAWHAVRSAPAPWAELESDRLVLTIPSESVRTLDDPAAVMGFWNRVLDACADLAARPRERDRPERIVADRQISAGYMHAGYPIMTHLDAVPRMLDGKGGWGLFHELGHNHQSGDWTFAGAGEVTVNLFTLYVFETVLGEMRARPQLYGEARERTLHAYREAGAPFAQWKREPFLALLMYVQLKEAFGWEPFREVFAEYRALPREARPRNDDEKRDQWMVRFSRRVGRNLGPFFASWGVPTSAEARASIADLPEWRADG